MMDPPFDLDPNYGVLRLRPMNQQYLPVLGVIR